MDFHCTGTDSEVTADFLVGSTFRKLRENFALTRRQTTLARKVIVRPIFPAALPSRLANAVTALRTRATIERASSGLTR
jgi:hypothetical protein